METSQRWEPPLASVRHRLPSLAWHSACCIPKPRINLRREPTSIPCLSDQTPLIHLQQPLNRNGRSVLYNSSAQLPSVLPKRRQRDLPIGSRGPGKPCVPVLVTHRKAMPHPTNYHPHMHTVSSMYLSVFAYDCSNNAFCCKKFFHDVNASLVFRFLHLTFPFSVFILHAMPNKAFFLWPLFSCWC